MVNPALNPFRTAVPFWGQPVKFQVFCPQNGTAVLKGLTPASKTARYKPDRACLAAYLAEAARGADIQVCVLHSKPFFLSVDIPLSLAAEDFVFLLQMYTGWNPAV